MLYKEEGQSMRKDFLFVMTKDLYMHLIDYSTLHRTLVPISSFKIDLGLRKSVMKEVQHICYDEKMSTLIIVFVSGYVMTVNLQRDQNELSNKNICNCRFHMEIVNFTVSEIGGERPYMQKYEIGRGVDNENVGGYNQNVC
jgi:hypothetical protein